MAQTDDPNRSDPQRRHVSDPAELGRIASMLHAMTREARDLELDEHGRDRIKTIHRRALTSSRTSSAMTWPRSCSSRPSGGSEPEQNPAEEQRTGQYL